MSTHGKKDLVDILAIDDDELAAITGGAAMGEGTISKDGTTTNPTPTPTPTPKTTLPGGGTGDPTAWSAEYGDELED